MRVQADVVVVGSGFGGSLMALVLQRLGLKAVLIDRGTHPRFAIGESTTPIANLVLQSLAKEYDLPNLLPLAKYGSWQERYPQVPCGLKRGFSYFRHLPGRPFVPRADHRNELLVAASSEDQHADTHWLRSAFDSLLVGQVKAANIPYFDRTSIAVKQQYPSWRLVGERAGESVEVQASLIIDASGEGRFLCRELQIADRASELHTQSRGLFAHFDSVHPWQEIYEAAGGSTADHPFPCDYAAVHQMIDEGWMWQLRFNNGVTSAGFALATSAPENVSPADEWKQLFSKYPSLAAQFADATIVAPSSGLCPTGRMQRFAEHAAGDNWVLLPHSAGFIDPLHSSGIAQTLCGIERLAKTIKLHWGKPTLATQLHHYETTVQNELRLIDKIVHGCYLAAADFEFYPMFGLLYFVAATTYERRRLAGQVPPGAAFLCADDPDLCATVTQAKQLLETERRAANRSHAISRFKRKFAEIIAPFNQVGLCDPEARNMYHRTAVPYLVPTTAPSGGVVSYLDVNGDGREGHRRFQ